MVLWHTFGEKVHFSEISPLNFRHKQNWPMAATVKGIPYILCGWSVVKHEDLAFGQSNLSSGLTTSVKTSFGTNKKKSITIFQLKSQLLATKVWLAPVKMPPAMTTAIYTTGKKILFPLNRRTRSPSCRPGSWKPAAKRWDHRRWESKVRYLVDRLLASKNVGLSGRERAGEVKRSVGRAISGMSTVHWEERGMVYSVVAWDLIDVYYSKVGRHWGVLKEDEGDINRTSPAENRKHAFQRNKSE